LLDGLIATLDTEGKPELTTNVDDIMSDIDIAKFTDSGLLIGEAIVGGIILGIRAGLAGILSTVWAVVTAAVNAVLAGRASAVLPPEVIASTKTEEEQEEVASATGLNMTIPPGFPNDSFKLPLALTSGEKLIVLNKKQQLDMQRSMSGVTQSSISNVNSTTTNNNNFNLNNSFRNATARSVSDDIRLLQMLGNT